MKTIQIELTDDQFATLTEQASAKNRSVDEYILDVLGISMEPFFLKLCQRVEGLAVGTPFTLKAVMATDWATIPKGIRLSMGRKFYRLVQDGTIKGVTALIPDPAGTMTYSKSS